MNCERIEQRLSAWIDGELPESERALLDEHLRGCERCRREADALAEVDRIYAGAGELTPGSGLRYSVQARIRSAGDDRWWNAWLPWLAPRPALAMAAAALVLASVTLWVGRSEAHPPVMTCRIEGMMCEQCDRQVNRILQTIPGVETVQVDAKTGRARMQLKRGGAVSVNELTRAINETRQYRVTDIEVVNGTSQKGGETK